MLRWFKFWNVKKCVIEYYHYIIYQCPVIPVNVHLLIFFLTIQLFHVLYLIFFPLTELQRLIHFDQTLIWSSSQQVNLIPLAADIEILYIVYCSFYIIRNDNKLQNTLSKTYNILYKDDNQHFVNRYLIIDKGFFKKLLNFQELLKNSIWSTLINKLTDRGKDKNGIKQNSYRIQPTLLFIQKLSIYYIKSTANFVIFFIFFCSSIQPHSTVSIPYSSLAIFCLFFRRHLLNTATSV